MGETLQWLANRYELQLEAKGLRLTVAPPEQDVLVAIEGQVLRQVAENLVTNALKYARDGGELDLRAWPGAPGYWQLIAQDRGPGIPETRQRQLFKPFQSSKTSGMGIGVYEAQQYLKELGGSLRYTSAPGEGTCATVRLPRVQRAADKEGGRFDG